MTLKLNTQALHAIDHIAIQVDNIKKAIEWYTKQFKCIVEYQDDSWAYIKFANIHLALVVPSQHPSHLAFKVENAAKYGALRTHRDGTQSIYVGDPAGNTIEFVESSSCK